MSTRPSYEDQFEEAPQQNQRLRFLNQISPEYLESLEIEYKKDPNSIPPDWAYFFDILKLGENGRATSTMVEGDPTVVDELRVFDLIQAYRMRGHLLAQVDPLNLRQPPLDPHLELSYFGLENVDQQRIFQAAQEIGLSPSPLSEIVAHLKATYTRTIGAEFHYIRDEKVANWLKTRVDKNQNRTRFSSEQKIKILQQLYKASVFENFLQTNYMGQKRFSLEGAEAVIPALNLAIEGCGELGAVEVVMGMAHRGRLNVLTNVMQKPYQEVFKEFEGAELPQLEEVMGDVKYHQGFSADITTSAGKKMHLSLSPNPSHLEFVNPVVEGMVRAKQEAKYEGNLNRVVPILIHGDAAVIGQGVVAETLNLSLLEGYKTGGTIHIVINNQIGFTTLPEDSRSSLYCTDFGKGFQTPIFHVNGDYVEDVMHVVQLAVEFRMTFNKDVFVDIYSYRRYGHNEGDEPRFTQPLMYSLISSHKSPLDIYLEKLKVEAQLDQALIDEFWHGFEKELAEKKADVQKSPKILTADMFKGLWSGFERPQESKLLEAVDTRIPEKTFDAVIQKIHEIPTHIHPLPKFSKMIETRHKKILEEDQIDWAAGEQLAFGSLLLEGYGIRLSGQDSVRGTFSQRHSCITDNQTSQRYFPLKNLDASQARFDVFDSPLSEAAVMGFDYGYSATTPKTLVLWEGQFGDFSNGAQVIIDQFIASAEAKWYRMSGITLLLPHGYEGQGPEHSSARLERYLQLCAQHNMQVAYPTTPAQYAHLLRRQMHRKFRKPLIVMTPKSMLRMPEVVSQKKDFISENFQTIIVTGQKSEALERVVLCSGKVYWDLKKAAEEAKIVEKTLFIRMEQLYPLDKGFLKEIHRIHGHLPWIWCQEEPKNMGAWSHIRMSTLDLGINLEYAGRNSSASPATGSAVKHLREQEKLIKEALGLK